MAYILIFYTFQPSLIINFSSILLSIRLQSFFKFLSKLNFILLASALLYSTSFNSHQFSWLGASYISVLQRACTWVYKQAQLQPEDLLSPLLLFRLQLLLSSLHFATTCCPGPDFTVVELLFFCSRCCLVSVSCAASPGGPIPSRLEFALEVRCPVDWSLPWRSHSQSTKVCLDFTHLLSCTTLVRYSRAPVTYSRAPLTYSRAPLSFTTHVLSCTTHGLSCTTQKLIIATVNIPETLIIATVNIVKILIATVCIGIFSPLSSTTVRCVEVLFILLATVK